MREVTVSSRRGFLADVLEKQRCWLSLPTRAFLSSHPPSLSATRSELPSSKFWFSRSAAFVSRECTLFCSSSNAVASPCWWHTEISPFQIDVSCPALPGPGQLVVRLYAFGHMTVSWCDGWVHLVEQGFGACPSLSGSIRVLCIK